MTAQHRIVLRARPSGPLELSLFRSETGPVPRPAPGQLLLRNDLLAIDPAIRGWMSAGRSYVEPIPLGGVIRSAVLGQVVESRAEGVAPGDWWVGLGGWEEYSAVDARMGRKLPALPLPRSYALSVLGGSGLTAWFGIHDVARPRPGETVVISAAAGGVGSVAGQLARLEGCRVIGIVGSDAKARWITEELGFDGAINRRTEDVHHRLGELCPGVDVYFDNVGGAILDAVLARIRVGARIAVCGAMSQLDTADPPPGPRNLIRLLTQRATMQGFLTLDYAERWQDASSRLARLILEGRLTHREDIVDGLDQAPGALIGLFAGDNIGKRLVRIRS